MARKNLDNPGLRLIASGDVTVADVRNAPRLRAPDRHDGRLSDELVQALTPPEGTHQQKMLAYLAFLHFAVTPSTRIEPHPLSFLREQVPMRFPCVTSGDTFLMLSLCSDADSPYERSLAQRVASELITIWSLEADALTKISFVDVRADAPCIGPRHLIPVPPSQ